MPAPETHSSKDKLSSSSSSHDSQKGSLSASPFMCMAIAVHGFTPESQLEKRALSLNVGDFVYVLEQHASGWWDAVVSRPTGAMRGWVPSNFLRVQENYTISPRLISALSAGSNSKEQKEEVNTAERGNKVSENAAGPAQSSNSVAEANKLLVATKVSTSNSCSGSDCPTSPTSPVPPSRAAAMPGSISTGQTEKWQKRITANGKHYYVNLETDKTTWDRPDGLVEEQPQADAKSAVSPANSTTSNTESVSSEELRSGSSPSRMSISSSINEASLKSFFPPNSNEAASTPSELVNASYENPTWEFLILKIISAAAALSRAAKASETAKIIPLTNSVLNAARKMLICTGLADKNSPLLRAFATLHNAHTSLLSFLTRLIIAAIVAGGMWPPPDACDILCRRLGQVLVALKQLVFAAFSFTPTGIVPVAFVDNPALNHSVVPAVDLQHCMHDSTLLSSLDKSRVSIANSLAQLNCLLAASNQFSNEILELVKTAVQDIGQCLSLVEDLRIADPKPKRSTLAHPGHNILDPNQVSAFAMRKDMVYNLANDLITCSRIAAEQFAPPNALESMMHNVTILSRSVDDFVITVKMLIDNRINNRQQELQTSLKQSIEEKSGSLVTSDSQKSLALHKSNSKDLNGSGSELNNLHRRVQSLSELSTESLSPRSTTSEKKGSASLKVEEASTASPRLSAKNKRQAPSPPSPATRDMRPESFSQESLNSKNEPRRQSFTSSTIARDHFHYEYAPDEILVKDEQVIGGTFNALVARLTLHDVTIDPVFMGAFLLTFRHFSNPQTFLDHLIKRFSIAAPESLKSTPEALSEWKEKKLVPVRLRVFNVMKTWLENYYLPDTDAPVLPEIIKFAEDVVAPAMPQPAKRLIDAAQRRLAHPSNQQLEQNAKSSASNLKPEYFRDSVVSAGDVSITSAPSIPLSRVASEIGSNSPSVNRDSTKMLIAAPVVINYIPIQPKRPLTKVICVDPLELARQLTIFEFKSFNKISGLELVTLCFGDKSSGSSPAPNVKEVIQLSNTISRWVTESILQELDVKRRSDVVKHWIKTADNCLQLKNFNTLRSIICALDSTNVSRLKKTWKLLSARKKDLLDQARRATDHSRNFSEYRAILRSTVPPCIPFLGLYLTDLTFINDGNKATRGLEGKLINFDKYIKAYNTVGEHLRFQVPYQLESLPEIQTFISRTIESVFSKNSTPESLYTLSLTIEPREDSN